MEMRVEKMGQELEINFDEFEVNMLTVLEEGEGVILIDIEDNENYYIGGKIKNLFEITNKKTIKKISYINNDFNKIKINQFYITLLNDKKYTLELL